MRAGLYRTADAGSLFLVPTKGSTRRLGGAGCWQRNRAHNPIPPRSTAAGLLDLPLSVRGARRRAEGMAAPGDIGEGGARGNTALGGPDALDRMIERVRAANAREAQGVPPPR